MSPIVIYYIPNTAYVVQQSAPVAFPLLVVYTIAFKKHFFFSSFYSMKSNWIFYSLPGNEGSLQGKKIAF